MEENNFRFLLDELKMKSSKINNNLPLNPAWSGIEQIHRENKLTMYIDGFVDITIIDDDKDYRIRIRAKTLLTFIKAKIEQEVALRYPEDGIQVEEDVLKKVSNSKPDEIKEITLEDLKSMSAIQLLNFLESPPSRTNKDQCS